MGRGYSPPQSTNYDDNDAAPAAGDDYDDDDDDDDADDDKTFGNTNFIKKTFRRLMSFHPFAQTLFKHFVFQIVFDEFIATFQTTLIGLGGLQVVCASRCCLIVNTCSCFSAF